MGTKQGQCVLRLCTAVHHAWYMHNTIDLIITGYG